MSSRMRRRKDADHKKPRTSTHDMLKCPMCNAMSYPRVPIDPQTEEEKNALYCGSCNINMTPFFEALKEYARVRDEQKKEEARKAHIAEEDEEENE